MSNQFRRQVLKRTALAVVLGACLANGAVYAQSTTGTIYGSAPSEAGSTIVVQSDTGLSRTITIDANGRYNLGSLPVGAYTVTLKRGDQVVDTRKNVQLRVGSGTEVSFADAGSSSTADATTLGAITVTAANAPKIDVSSTTSRSVITSEQLATLPLGRSAEAIALLAPGAVSGAGAFNNGSRSVVSFGGSGVTENAYYINGFNVSNPFSNLGGVSLPYGAIDQQETYTGGYSAKYGRSTGGVINQLGKRGTNEWHFGVQSVWEPDSLASSRGDVWFPNATLPAGYDYDTPDQPGTLYRAGKDNTQTRTVYSAYAGGPLIEDRLFIFVAGESEKVDGVSTNASSDSIQARNNYEYSTPKFYGKLDWNINDNNIVEYTRIQNTDRRSGAYTSFDYDGLVRGGPTGTFPDTFKIKDTYDIFKYTGYITDDLTLNATWGRSTQHNQQFNPFVSDLPFLGSVTSQNPAITGGTPIRNNQATNRAKADDPINKTRSLRLELNYRLGDHDLTAGVDNMYFNAYDEGVRTTGPGYQWIYGRAADEQTAVRPGLGVGATGPGSDGYYAQQRIFTTTTSMAVEQKAYYLEDRWQVNDKWLLTLGIRNDQFTNYNSDHVEYVDSGDQWAPRFGASWDVFGDSSLKVFANLGRYYLALPNSVAVRGASASTYTDEYFTYTGIDANGEPTGLAPIGPGPVSSNGEYGQAPDPNAFAPTDLKSQYQDEFILGFEKTLGESWNSGAKFTYRKLQSAIDDVCDTARIADKLVATGGNPDAVDIPGCVMFNPGKTNTYSLANADGSGYTQVQMSQQDWGFTDKAKRSYVSVDLFLEHPFDEKWYGRVDYTWSHSYGNTEGQVKSDLGQADVSKTQDWDAAALMYYAGGSLANDRRHQLKAFGAYQISPEWMASATLRVMSGTPRTCLGYFENGQDPISYGSAYHYCGGQPSNPGDAGRTPWIKNVDLGVTYRPSFADHKLAVGLQIFNVLNDRSANRVDGVYETDPGLVSNTYGIGLQDYSYNTPRYLRLSASYDF
ncbi:TonB-dependent receptor [Xanthomonas campestris pv. raphani]|uniref:TonB-dependent receptor n=1 Tax=Xanthomonas campestris TaxID=339 RepID=UPI001E5FE7C1|nr:TonB-dependent receptor [Xanthomonas campestris]MCC5068425.1 TonB-dependent receptor [Xanthomonas campestris]MCC5085229.1 TonB-dependent receptor [Xanthomonas campestris]MEA9748782.1 TonB-dependent receptor [Xanthomonas campestris pv. raphani]MEA9847727.1 TonB-dependent receptor [Xanthomonas campestris pv. raphani]MEA9929191.1 TonB-dependent receptor [Xanthomonas campestris pv. raphani]